MRTFLFVFLGLLFTSSLSAQYFKKEDRLIVGLNAGIVKPIGDFANESDLGTDLSLNAKLLLNPKIAIGLSLAYIDFDQEDEFWNGDVRRDNDVNYQVIPLVFTATYFIQAYDLDFRPYASLGFGYFLYRNHVESTPTNTYKPQKEEYTVLANKIGLVPNVGFMYNLSKELAVDVNLKLTYVPNFEDKLEKKKIKPDFENGTEPTDRQKYLYLGFNKISSISLTAGLYYRF